MNSQIVDRSLQLAMHAALAEQYDKFSALLARLRTLDRHGEIDTGQYLALEGMAHARAGHVKQAEVAFARLIELDQVLAQETKRRLLESTAEAEEPAFCMFVERIIPDPPPPLSERRDARTGPRWPVLAGSMLAGAIVISIVVLLFLPRESEVVGPPQSLLGRVASSVKGDPKAASTVGDLASIHRQMERTVGKVVQRWHILLDDGGIAKVPVSSGTGFVVARDGLILTNRHVVDGGAEALAQYADVIGWDIVVVFGTTEPLVIEGGITQQSTGVDLAWIRVDHLFEQALAFGSTPFPGQSVKAYGFPGVADDVAQILNEGDHKKRYQTIKQKLNSGQEPDLMEWIGPNNMILSVTSGVISAVRETEQGMMLQTDTFIHFGNSGGPLVDDTGRIVGMVTFKATTVESTNFCLAGKTIFEELARVPGIAWPDEW